MTEQLAILIAATTTTGDPTADLVRYLVGYGLLGLLLVDVLVTQRLVIPKRSYDALSEERDLREQILTAERDRVLAELAQIKGDYKALQEQYMERFLPALTSATEVVRAMTDMASRRMMRDDG